MGNGSCVVDEYVLMTMRAPFLSYLYSEYVSWKTGNLEGLRPKILSYFRNTIRVASTGRLIVDERVHLSTRPNIWPSCVYIEVGEHGTLHFTGRASLRGESRILVDDGANVRIGNRCFLRERLWIAAHKAISIGDGTAIGPGCTIMDSDVHPISINGACQEPAGAITIGNNVWVGACSIILKGVTIGEHSIIGAGSLVSRDIPDHVMAVGRPARPIRSIDHGKLTRTS